MISYDDFQKVEMTAGKILSAEKIPNTEKLLKLSVDFGVKKTEFVPVIVDPSSPIIMPVEEKDIRQIVSGIALYFPDPQALVGRNFMFVTNLEPRQIKGFTSNGMILAVKTDTTFSLLEVPEGIVPGTKAN